MGRFFCFCSKETKGYRYLGHECTNEGEDSIFVYVGL
jgi:hypothetical protein